MTTTRVLLLRHAETAAPDRFHGAESDIGLGERGLLQAREAAGRIAPLTAPVAVYSSAMLRARQTAAPIAEARGLEPAIVPDLHERRMGPLSGMTLEEGWPDYIAAMDRAGRPATSTPPTPAANPTPRSATGPSPPWRRSPGPIPARRSPSSPTAS